MNNLIKYILLIAIVTIFASCNEDVGDFTVKGESITAFELSGPENNDSVKINTGALSEPYTFSWAKAESGLGSPVKYTLVFDLPDGDFSQPLWSKVSDESGSLNHATLTFEELKQIYTKAGNSGDISLKWNVKAENGSPNSKMGQVANLLKLTLSTDGVNDFRLLKPIKQSAVIIDGALASEQFVFDWEDAVTTSGQVTYKFYLDVINSDFSNPIITLNSDNEGKDSQVSMTQAQWKNLLDQKLVTKGAYQWTVKAFSADQEWMNETFQIFIDYANWSKPIYIVGEATNVGWDITKALTMGYISPNVWTGVFELKAGKEFKLFPVKGSWDNGIGADRFTTFIGCSAVDGGNILNTGTVDGSYFIIVDLNTLTITVSPNPKILGGSLAAGWSTENAVPMLMNTVGIYDSYQYITVAGEGFKFVPQNSGWDGDLGTSKTKPGSLVQTEEDNLTVPKDGFYRVRVNMKNMTYLVDETNWGIVGTATPGGATVDTDMTFTNVKGDYVWSADVTLTKGDIKFRANHANAINLGADGTGGLLKYGGANIPVEAGNYHIELSLNSATGFRYTITAK